MPWTAKWIAAIVGTFVLLVIADRIWYVQEMKALAAKLGMEWSKIERRGTFPYEYYKKVEGPAPLDLGPLHAELGGQGDRKSTRLNSSHSPISYAVFCLEKKKK